MLKNESYTGILKSGETKSEIFPELQIIDTDIFSQVQKMLTERSVQYKERNIPLHTKGQGLLSGNIYCGHCGGRLTSNTRRDHNKDGSVREYVRVRYLFIFWCCLKLGTAYRIASGADFGTKLIGTIKTIGPAFGTIAPGLVAFDWLVGIVGVVVIRLIVYYKVKNAKKFRKDVEYGSARWGTAADIKPFVDPVFKNNVILTGTEFLTMNTRPKNPANSRNLNCCVIGSSGSGKTRFWLTPQLLQAHSSFVVVDPKGGILGQVGSFLEKQGYRIKVFNSIDFSKSMHYDPLSY